MGVVTKRSSMTFFSDGASHYSHRVRIVLAEKGVAVDIIDVDPDEKPAELADHNPYNELPTLVDRDLVLYEADIMMEYLDERFPHPPLLPVYPVARAQSRLMMYRISKDWCSLVDSILADPESSSANEKRKEFKESLLATAPIFADKPFFMSEEFTIVDCCIAALLWRLPVLGIELSEPAAKPILRYMDQMFSRESFQESLSEVEAEMRH
ncbi:stringent starvation protein A [Oleiphilus sp. HI0009]|nr:MULTISPECIES: glutathione S-transferase N-terminal domain-containing protein [unclassified Oleiphilus]KZX86452.1 stringent starvation protein A [Oleiphilus sp. HI0009]MCH2159604.1 glutathione S-transferase N-terminal domain-containing protein [Oleiphilaceae bacterium]KZY69088.1 stringent starvation protein A [Oleiphilus sp. HI0066]KZY70505.1 stringent starvation protein A [Oleiphilus sp. HI0067]KZZ58283.1 stringent starvation protein A [Oleiphilus sp. HI0125]